MFLPNINIYPEKYMAPHIPEEINLQNNNMETA
jgi:hypothetical protein